MKVNMFLSVYPNPGTGADRDVSADNPRLRHDVPAVCDVLPEAESSTVPSQTQLRRQLARLPLQGNAITHIHCGSQY